MRRSLISTAILSMLALEPAYAAPIPEPAVAGQQAFVAQWDEPDGGLDFGSMTFRLDEWRGDNGSGGFPLDFNDENWRGDPWEDFLQ